MSFHIEHYETKEEWIKAHKDRISGSYASAILGESHFKTNVQAFKEIIKPNLIDKPSKVMKLGTDLEAPMRETFAVLFGEKLEVNAPPTDGYDLYVNDQYPFLIATVDGVLMSKKNGSVGGYEGKTKTVYRRGDLQEWQEHIPEEYYYQVLHYMLVTGWDYFVMNAMLMCKLMKEDKTYDEYQVMRQYLILKSKAKEDLDNLLQREIEVYEKHIKTGIPPELIKKEEKENIE